MTGSDGINSYQAVIGAPDYRRVGERDGQVYFYSFRWNSQGGDINTEWTKDDTQLDYDSTPFSKFGATLSVTGDSKTIAVGAPNHGDLNQGAVRVFSQVRPLEWEIITIPHGYDETEYEANCGSSVSFDDSGKYLAIGCPNAFVDGQYNVGKVKIWKRGEKDVEGNYIWKFKELLGGNEGDMFGSAVKLSNLEDGIIFLAVGAPKRTPDDDPGLLNAGRVSVYYNTGEEDWETAGLELDGLSFDGRFGSSIDLADSGHTVIAGAPEGGYAKIYQLAHTAPPTPSPTYSVGSIEMKQRSSVWMVFFITIFSFGLLGVVFAYMKKLRESRSTFSGLSTADEHGSEMTHYAPRPASTPMPPSSPSPAAAEGDLPDVI